MKVSNIYTFGEDVIIGYQRKNDRKFYRYEKPYYKKTKEYVDLNKKLIQKSFQF